MPELGRLNETTATGTVPGKVGKVGNVPGKVGNVPGKVGNVPGKVGKDQETGEPGCDAG
jgi:hypothetical protein